MNRKSFRECMKDALINAIGSRPSFDLVIAAGDWVKLGVFVEEDVVDIQAAIDNKNTEHNEETM